MNQQKLDQIKHVHLIGIYGISVSSLALISAKRGYSVSGSDNSIGTETQRKRFVDAGIRVFHGCAPENLPTDIPPECIAVVYTAAVKPDEPELSAARSMGMRIFGRAEFMELLTCDIPIRIGVSGTHGKSTVCGMIAEIMLAAELDPDVLCGAELPSIGGAWRLGASERIVYEACEYKNSFLQLHPTVAVITNIEEDHVDFFHGIEEISDSFFNYASGVSRAIVGIDSTESERLANRLGESAVTCSVTRKCADYFADGIKTLGGVRSFTLCYNNIKEKISAVGEVEDRKREPQRICDISLRVVGAHNLSNALIAAATAMEIGIPPEFIAEGLGRFSGLRRRMEYRGEFNGALIYDDYAHHPTEIKAALAAARSMGFRFICCAFQPHTYSRTAHFFCDFANSFTDADEVLYADIYAAREQNTYGITSKELATVTKNGYYLPTRELIAEHFKRIAAPGVLLLTMGAGELNKVAELIIDGKL